MWIRTTVLFTKHESSDDIQDSCSHCKMLQFVPHSSTVEYCMHPIRQLKGDHGILLNMMVCDLTANFVLGYMYGIGTE